MDWTTIGTLLARHTLTTAGGWLVANGFLPDGMTAESFVGAGMVIAGVAWSWWQKAGHAQAIAELKAAADYWRNKKVNSPVTPTQGAHP
jgi:hypothetical protein